MELKRVVVTGIGAITPIGNNLQEYWDGLVNGVSGSDLITLFDASNHKTRFACEVKNYNPSDYFDRKELKKLDRFSQFAMIAADEALTDAALDLDTLDKDRIGIIWSSGIGGIKTYQDELDNYFSGGRIPHYSPFFIPRMIIDIAAGLISMKYGFRGPNYATVSACASSTNAIIDAASMIQLGHADIMICGGSEAAITEAGIGGFNSMMAMSTDNDNYKSASRPLDRDRDGFVMGEGGGLILETYEHAKERGARIYAELAGAGLSADAFHLTAPHPEGLGATIVMKNALQHAGVDPSGIDYINIHGTATPLGDISEVKAIKSVFGEHAYKLNISATKSMTGHLLGAAGAIEAIAVIMAVVHDIVPPTINHRNNDPELDSRLNYTLNKAQKRTVHAAMSNTFGFGGHNTSVIFKKTH